MHGVGDICTKVVQFSTELKEEVQECKLKLHSILYNVRLEAQPAPLKAKTHKPQLPEKKRAKRLMTLDEGEDEVIAPSLIKKSKSMDLDQLDVTDSNKKKISTTRRSQKSSSCTKENISNESSSKKGAIVKSASELMPPPPAPPVAVASSTSDLSFSRPQRAAKLTCERNLKELPLNTKLRRPSNEDTIKIKVESEQRASAMHESIAAVNQADSSVRSMSQDSVIVLPVKETSIVSVASSDIEPTTIATAAETSLTTKQNGAGEGLKTLRVRIKRERFSSSLEQQQSCPEMKSSTHTKDVVATAVESTMVTSMLSITTNSVNTTQNKKGRRKGKPIPMPIKVENINNIPSSPIATRTRKMNKSIDKQADKKLLDSEQPVVQDKRNASIQESFQDSKEKKSHTFVMINETVTVTKQMDMPTNVINSTMVLDTAPNDETYCTASATTFVLDSKNVNSAQTAGGNDLTFNVTVQNAAGSQRSADESMKTARDTLQPNPDSLITEDESFECPETARVTTKNMKSKPLSNSEVTPKPNGGLLYSANTLPLARACKLPARTVEIFNPLVQSPVKKKVEAYETVAAAQAASKGAIKRTRSKQSKENVFVSNSSTTPVIGKLTAASGRFLTPPQSSNITPYILAQSKKLSASTSKVTSLRKSGAMGILKTTASETKSIVREDSGEDFRKALRQITDERKKQREEKHRLVALQREAKERERVERVTKLAKEREEKRLKRQQEAEQRKLDLLQIQKQLREQEEAAAADLAQQKAKYQMEKKKALLQQSKPPANYPKSKAGMPPPPPKNEKYTFDMLHQDDSTDDEGKTSYKRPPVPAWSRSDMRGPYIQMQQYMPTPIIDSFFSVQPMTPDLETIFPAIDPRYLKRNSSVFWSTPPRYSELPKY